LDDFYRIERENSFFCFNIPPLVGTQIINCTAQGKVTRQTKERKSDTQQVTNRVGYREHIIQQFKKPLWHIL
jgi:hypothetical protein